MTRRLQIHDPRERLLVGLADALLAVATAPARWLGGSRRTAAPKRILLLRLERIGDLLMTLAPIAAVRRLAPEARIDLVVGSWNAPLAGLLSTVDHVETLDAGWLARDQEKRSTRELFAKALSWRARKYDLGINFEGDIRGNLLLGISGAPRRVGFSMAGGGPVLTDCVDYDPRQHVTVNAFRLVERAFQLTAGSLQAAPAEERIDLPIPIAAARTAAALLQLDASSTRAAGSQAGRPDGFLVGIQAAGGRAIKHWDPRRFAEVAAGLGRQRGATIVLTGDEGDRAVVEEVKAAIPPDVRVIDLAGRADLLTLGAVLQCLRVFITGDTGPMHFAAALGTPTVALFGPSDPARWGPRSAAARIIRVGLPCSPCNRIRRPPEQCVGHVPDCMRAIEVSQVVAAALELVDGAGPAVAGAVGAGLKPVPTMGGAAAGLKPAPTAPPAGSDDGA
jgi:ADP-heptose:LPS heptosyltransferase